MIRIKLKVMTFFPANIFASHGFMTFFHLLLSSDFLCGYLSLTVLYVVSVCSNALHLCLSYLHSNPALKPNHMQNTRPNILPSRSVSLFPSLPLSPLGRRFKYRLKARVGLRKWPLMDGGRSNALRHTPPYCLYFWWFCCWFWIIYRLLHHNSHGGKN